MKSELKFWSISTLLLGLLMLLLAWGFSQWHLQGFTRSVGDRLQLLSELRQNALQRYFSTAEAELKFWSTSPQILESQQSFNELWQSQEPEQFLAEIRSAYIDNNPHPDGDLRKLNRADEAPYSQLHAALHDTTRRFVTERGYYDVFLIGNDGTVFYTVEKEQDFGTNLLTGEWRNSSLADIYRRARGQTGSVAMSDFQAYEPSNGAPAIFLGKSISSPDGEPLGVIVFQLPTEEILDIMGYTAGMGETGETYVVGEDYLMRSASRFSETSTVLQQRVETESVVKALAGEEGVDLITDYRGVEVLSAYSAIDLGSTKWAVLAEIDRQEIISAAANERPEIATALTFLFGLSFWSIWYWRGRQLTELAVDLPPLDHSGSHFGDDSSMGG
ncbi:MAG: cache domain-containing protein [Halioglobus sp.]